MEDLFLKNRIHWNEPFDGDGIFSMDTGFCNRIFHWENSFLLNKNNGNRYNIYVQDIYWPELKYINLPNTIVFHKGYNETLTEYKKRFASFLVDESIDKEKYENIIKNKTSIKDKNYFFNQGYNYIDQYTKLISQKYDRPLRKIQLKDDNIKTSIINFMRNKVGIHIRRGIGVNKNKSQVDYLNNLNNGHNFDIEINQPYDFYEDPLYLTLMDRIKKMNPKIQFYISSDMGAKQKIHFEEHYPGDVFCYEDILKFSHTYIHYQNLKYEDERNVFVAILDLFSLSYSKLLIKSPKSTWSDFAQLYNDIPYLSITDDLNKSYLNIKRFINV